jgi:hypothetical protein
MQPAMIGGPPPQPQVPPGTERIFDLSVGKYDLVVDALGLDKPSRVLAGLEALHKAIECGHLDTAAWLAFKIRKHPDFIAGLPVIWAVRARSLQMVIMLHEDFGVPLYSDRHWPSCLSNSALAFGAATNQLDMVNWLMEHGDIQADTLQCADALARAALSGHLEVFNSLTDVWGVPVSVNDWSALTSASITGSFDVIQHIISRCPAGEVPPYDTAFRLLCLNGHFHAAVYVYGLGAAEGIDDGTVLMWAVRGGNLDLVTYFHEHKGIPEDADSYGAMTWAASEGHLHVVRYFHEKRGVPTDAPYSWALACAAEHGHLATVKYLIAEGASTTAPEGDSVLAWAAMAYTVDIIKYLIDDCGIPADVEHGVALMSAALWGSFQTVQLLINHYGVPPNIRNGEALMQAVSGGHLEIATWLVQVGGIPANAQDGKALLLAVEHERAEIVAWLIGLGVAP